MLVCFKVCLKQDSSSALEHLLPKNPPHNALPELGSLNSYDVPFQEMTSYYMKSLRFNFLYNFN